MALPANHARFHFDPNRGEGCVPEIAALNLWCMNQLIGPEGEETRNVVAEAGRSVARRSTAPEGVRDVAVATAAGMRAAAREIHDIAREFGFDPTVHPHTVDACIRLCLSRVSVAAGRLSGAERSIEMLEEIVSRLIHAVRLTSEAQAVTALAHSMIERGRCDYEVFAAAREEVHPDTAVMIDEMWGRRDGDWSMWPRPSAT